MLKSRIIQEQIKRSLGQKTCFYVTRDIERAVAGLLLDIPNFHIITNDAPYARELIRKYPKNIIILKNKITVDTLGLLQLTQETKTIKKNDLILVFKNTPQIEKICAAYGWKLLNPPAELAGQVEEKISQIKWLGTLAKFLPGYQVAICKNIFWTGKKFILQFNRSHTGSGTILITDKKQLEEIRRKFPRREARIAEYISGPLFTNNNIVWGNKILPGNISYQITGLKPFTDLPFATIGNDWALPAKILGAKQKKEYLKIATAVGKKLARQNWKGLFGIDVVMDEKTKKLYLLEINARQPASATFESELQSRQKNGITVFEAHLGALLGVRPEKFSLIKITNGAQIIQRVTSSCHRQERSDEAILTKSKKYKIIKYQNTKPGADLWRLQSPRGLMSGHNKLKKL